MLKVTRAALPVALAGAMVGCASTEQSASRTVTVVERTVTQHQLHQTPLRSMPDLSAGPPAGG